MAKITITIEADDKYFDENEMREYLDHIFLNEKYRIRGFILNTPFEKLPYVGKEYQITGEISFAHDS